MPHMAALRQFQSTQQHGVGPHMLLLLLLLLSCCYDSASAQFMPGPQEAAMEGGPGCKGCSCVTAAAGSGRLLLSCGRIC
jgi:hypothetical protein